MPGNPQPPQSPAAAFGCSLIVMGLVAAGFGLAALLGWSDRIELEFFSIELNDRLGRLFWTIGSLAMAFVGAFLVRRFRPRK